MITFKDGLTIGGDSPIRINCNVGCNNISDIESEISKLKFIQSCNELPDMMMDLSLIELNCTPKVRQKTFGVQFITGSFWRSLIPYSRKAQNRLKSN